MRICHITTAHPRNDIRIFHKECKTLVKHYPDFHLIVADGLGDEITDGINIHDIGKSKGRTERFIKTVNKAKEKALSINADIYHIHDPELLRIVKKIKKTGAKIIFDAHEDLPRQIITKPYIPKFLRKTIAVLIENYENKIGKILDGIITATPHIRNRFLRINTNSIDINNFPLLSEVEISETQEAKQNKVCYIGAISRIRGITELITALEYTKVKLDLAGEIPQNYRKELMQIKGWKNVNELGYVDRKTARRIKRESLAGMVTFLPVPNHINSQPNKIFEYMASEIPVIGSDFPLWKEIIENNNCGICVNPSNPREIAKAINYLAENPEKAKEMGKNGNKSVPEKYNWENEQKKLLDFYKIINK